MCKKKCKNCQCKIRTPEETLILMKKTHKKLISSPEKAKQFLVDCGIVDNNGNLTEHYR